MKFTVLVLLFNMLIGCAFIGRETPPSWINGNSQEFTDTRYLLGMGEGDSRELAKQRAYAEIARIFSATVTAQFQDREIYSQLDTDDGGTTNRQLMLDHLTLVSTEKVLENVHVLDSWYQPENVQFFALAGLDRQKAERKLLERLAVYDMAIDINVKHGRAQGEVITRLRGYKRAIRDLHLRRLINEDLRIVRLTGEGVSTLYVVEDIQRELEAYLLKDVRIDLKITGDQHAQVRQAVWEGLNREGFVTLDHGTKTLRTTEANSSEGSMSPDFLITGTTRLDDLKLFDPLFKYVRWCSDLQIIESHGHRVIGVVSRSGREGHITQQEARVRASQAMQAVVSTEIAQSFVRYIYDEHTERSSSSSCLPQE